MQFRQGDVFLKKCDDLPELETNPFFSIEGEEIEGFIILAHGEATGHKHAIKIEDDNVSLFKCSANDNRFFLIVKTESDLKHEEHSTIKVPPGKYQVIRQREYTPESIRYVAD